MGKSISKICNPNQPSSKKNLASKNNSLSCDTLDTKNSTKPIDKSIIKEIINNQIDTSTSTIADFEIPKDVLLHTESYLIAGMTPLQRIRKSWLQQDNSMFQLSN